MTESAILNRLLREGTIERVSVNRYTVHNTVRVQQLNLGHLVGHPLTRAQVQLFFMARDIDGEWHFARVPHTIQTPEAPQRLRTITRNSYHSAGAGRTRNGLQAALQSIQVDEDGVRRSFGLEWEINRLTSQQEDKLARLLDTLPTHYTERDGSLSSTGVEIIFLPLGLEKIIEVWNKLKTFCIENHVDMDGTGAHLTYGVSNSHILGIGDLTVRLNRIALAVKASSTQRQIKEVFGRDFTGYARLPQSTTESGHSMAWSASRGYDAYELRLCNWQGNIEKITQFMKATEFIFNRTFTAQDFMNIFRIMGQDCEGV